MSSMPSVTLLPKPEEPTVEAFIGDVKERHPTGGLSRPVGGSTARPLGFPQVIPSKEYGLRTLRKDAMEVAAAPTVEPRTSVATIHVPPVSTCTQKPDEGGHNNAAAIVLATLHFNSFIGDTTHPLPDALLLAVGCSAGGPASASLTSSSSFTPQHVSGEDFVQLVERALSSAISHHRLAAMDVILRELSSPPLEACDRFRQFFLFGPHCGRRVHRLVLCLSQASPREVVKTLEVLSKLVGGLLSPIQQHAETLSDFAVPLGDASVDVAPFLSASEQPMFEPFPSEDQQRQYSEDLRLDVGKALYLIGLHVVLPRVALAPSEWSVVAGIAAPEARRVFWSLLSMCTSYPSTVVAWFGSGGTESNRGGAFLELVKREISATLQPFVLGHQSYLSSNGNNNTTDEDSVGDEVLLSLLQCLRRVCHVRQGCFALVETIRPLLLLLLEHFQQDIGCNASLLMASSSSTDVTTEKKNVSSNNVSARSASHQGVMVYIGSLVILRTLIRHGCDQMLADCISHVVALVPLGSLGVAELALLSSVGADSNDQNTLPPSIASSLAQEAYRIIARSCEAPPSSSSPTHHHVMGANHMELLELVAQSTAFQYLATYVGMEGLRAFAPWLAPTIPEAQQTIKTLLGSKLMTSMELENMFPTPRQQKAVETSVRLAVKSSLQLGRSYNFVRFLTSIPRVFPATRTVVHGYCDTIVSRLTDLMFGGGGRVVGSCGVSIDIASQCKSVGGIVLCSPLTVEELSTALEVVTALSAFHADDAEDNGDQSRRSAGSMSLGLKRNAKAVAVLLLDIIAKTMQCLDSAPLLAALLFPDHVVSSDAVVAAVSARAADGNGPAMDPATTSSGWMAKLLWLHVPAGVEVMTTALVCHPRSRYVFQWEMLFSDFILWSCSHRASTKDEERTRCDAMLVFAQVALTEGRIIHPSVNQSIASTIGPYITAAFAVVSPRLPPSIVGALCVGAVLLQPEGALACLRVLMDTHDDFSAVLSFFSTHEDAHARCEQQQQLHDGGQSSSLSFLDVLFHQSLCVNGSLEAQQRHHSHSTLVGDGSGEDISAWSSLQRIVECLQLVVPLFRVTHHGSWPHLVCGYMIRRLSSNSSAARHGGGAVVAMQSDFTSMCIQDTLQTLHWEGFDVEDKKVVGQTHRPRNNKGVSDDAAARLSGDDGDVADHDGQWDEDEFAF
jgi:hypothetical protein